MTAHQSDQRPDTTPQPPRRHGRLIGGVVSIVLLALIAVLFVPAIVRSRSCAAMLQCYAVMRYTGEVIRDHLSRNEPLPPSLGLLFLHDYATPNDSLWSDRNCSAHGPEIVRIGEYTLADWLHKRVDHETLWAAAAEAPDEGPWRSAGHLYFCVEPDALLSWEQTRITGFAEAPGPDRGRHFLILFADGHLQDMRREALIAAISEHISRYGDDLPPELHALAATPPRRR